MMARPSRAVFFAGVRRHLDRLPIQGFVLLKASVGSVGTFDDVPVSVEGM